MLQNHVSFLHLAIGLHKIEQVPSSALSIGLAYMQYWAFMILGFSICIHAVSGLQTFKETVPINAP